MILRITALFLAAALALGAEEPLVVIGNLASGVTRMSREEVGNLFMGRQKRLSSGLLALPVEPVADPGLRGRFYQLLVQVPLPQLRAYWARMYFSGQAQPPRQAKNADEVIEIVLANRGAIGFVEQTKLDRRVKAVLILQEPVAP